MLRKAIKNTYILSLGTLFSRILGFIRDVLIANFFGTADILEAFLVAFRLPNIFRSLFAEGFSDSVATPVLSEYQKDKRKIFDIGSNLVSLSVVALLIVTFLGIVFAKQFVMLIAPGFIAEGAKFNLAVSFTRITFIYLFFIGLSSAIISILYSLKKFFAPAFTPAFLNISFIVGILFFSRFFKNYILAICVVAAGILQLVFPFISLKKEGFVCRFNLFRALADKQIRRMLKLFIPRIWSSLVYHMSIYIDTIFSSLSFIVGQGALAAVYYANRLIQFPFALIALSIARVAIVDLSSYHSRGNMEEFKKLFVFSFQNIIFFIVPISLVFAFIPRGIIEVVFARGKFGSHSLDMTSLVFFFYSLGLFFFCGIKLLVNSFYSLKDTKLPAKTATLALLVNIALSAILMFTLGISGVALGSSLAAMFNFFLLYYFLKKRIGYIDWQDTGKQFLKVFILGIVTGLSCRFILDTLLVGKYLRMSIALVSGLFIFILGGYLLGLRHISYLKQWILKRS